MAGSRSFPQFRGRGLAAGVAVAVLLTTTPSLALLEPIGPKPTQLVELELMLAVDVSSSVSPEEF